MVATGASMSGLLVACGGSDNDESTATTRSETQTTSSAGTPAGTTVTGGQASPTSGASPSVGAAPSTGASPGTGSPTAGAGQRFVDPGKGQAAAPSDAKKGGTLIVANEADMNEGDPQKYSGTHAGRTLRNIFDPLVTIYDDSSELRGGLASAWEISPDGLTYTFTIRETTFHDGTPVNAESCAFTFQRVLDENNEWYQKTGPFPFAKSTWPYVIPDQITAVDPQTLQFKLSQVDSTFLDNLTWAGAGIISPDALKKTGMDFTTQPVGAGPFKFSSWEKGASFIIERFDDYWADPPLLDKVIFKPVEESAARLVQLQNGDVNLVVALPPEFIGQIESDDNLELHETQGIHIWWVTLNMHEDHFKDKRVRQAMNYAIDKEAIIQNVLAGAAVVSHSFGFPNTPAYTDEVTQYEYDPEKAKQLLADAGYPDGFSTTYIVPESGSGMVAPKEIATVMQAQLKEVGVDVEIQTLEWTSYISAYVGGMDKASNNASAGMAQLSYMIPQPDPGMYAFDLLAGQGSLNAGYYDNPEVDALLSQAKGEPDPAMRIDLYKQAQALVADDAPWIFMFHAYNVVATSNNVKNIVLNPDFNILHLERVYLEG